MNESQTWLVNPRIETVEFAWTEIVELLHIYILTLIFRYKHCGFGFGMQLQYQLYSYIITYRKNHKTISSDAL